VNVRLSGGLGRLRAPGLRPQAAAVALATAALCVAPGVQGHLVTTRFGDFYSGMLHPLTALGTLVPWVALGLLTGLQDVRSGRWVLLVFPAGLLAGAHLAGELPDVGFVPGLNLSTLILAGALAGLALRMSSPVLLAFGLVLGLIHGYENGLAMTPGGSRGLFAAGVTLAGYVGITLITAGAAFLTRGTGWGSIAVRAAGSWAAAVGIMMVGMSFIPR